ncbi:MAG: CDP-alcohol phosphatidyltransferase family protein, partial [Planctomycetota bacterium]
MIKQIPNILTLGRFVLTIIFLLMVLYSPHLSKVDPSRFIDIAFVLFVLAGLTDMVDGTIARKLGVTSKFGRIMDPLAD